MYIVERFGKYNSTWTAGLHMRIPFMEKITHKVSLMEQKVDLLRQQLVSKDNVSIRVTAVVYFKVVDPRLYAYSVEYPISAVEELAAATLRNVVSIYEYDRISVSEINTKVNIILGDALEAWGIEVNRVEIEDIFVDGTNPLCDAYTYIEDNGISLNLKK